METPELTHFVNTQCTVNGNRADGIVDNIFRVTCPECKAELDKRWKARVGKIARDEMGKARVPRR